MAAACRNVRSLNRLCSAIIAHRQLGVDVLFLGEPRQRGAFVAELVDQLKPKALMPGEDAAVVDRGELVVGEMAALLHQRL